jgi:hypothetical protein
MSILWPLDWDAKKRKLWPITTQHNIHLIVAIGLRCHWNKVIGPQQPSRHKSHQSHGLWIANKIRSLAHTNPNWHMPWSISWPLNWDAKRHYAMSISWPLDWDANGHYAMSISWPLDWDANRHYAMSISWPLDWDANKIRWLAYITTQHANIPHQSFGLWIEMLAK